MFRVTGQVQEKWKRLLARPCYWMEDATQFTLRFEHQFCYAETETTYFAFTFPFSYQESIE